MRYALIALASALFFGLFVDMEASDTAFELIDAASHLVAAK